LASPAIYTLYYCTISEKYFWKFSWES